jgi:hypothetical protein
MEKINRKILKERMLLVFIGLSMVLILLIWSSNLLQPEQTQPEYYRDTYQYDSDSLWFTETAIAEEYLQQYGVTPTPPPTKKHQHQGPGRNSGSGRDFEGLETTITP